MKDLQSQAEAVTARSAPEKEVQALGTNLAEGDGLGAGRLKLHANTHRLSANHT